MSIVVVLPTRGRPGNALEAAIAFERTRRREDTYLLIVMDEDDPELSGYSDLSICDVDQNVRLFVGPRIRMGPTLNREAVRLASRYDIVGFIGDDHRFRTLGWDTVIHETLSAGPGVAYGDDTIMHQSLPTAVFVSSTIITALGYMAPPGLLHMYLDNAWLQIGSVTSLHYLPEVIIEHMHPIAGKSDWDPQYVEVNELMGRDGEEYQRWLQHDWPVDMQRLVS